MKATRRFCILRPYHLCAISWDNEDSELLILQRHVEEEEEL